MKRKNMYRNVGGKKIHVNQLAAMSRKYTVSNTNKGISPVVNHKRISGDIPKDKLITNPLTGNQFVMTNPHNISGNYGITITGYDWIPVDEYKVSNGLLWEHKKYPQPKRLHKKFKKKYYLKGTHTIRKIVEIPSDYAQFPNYPYTLPKLNKVEYMEKLVGHKTAKWERKNPCPAEMFTEDVEKWKQLRETMKERFRDFVVSIYDPLIVMGNRVNVKKQKIDASKIAEVKDVDGKGHDVSFPNLSTEDKLYKNAESAAKNVMKKDASILDADLMNHKRNQKRPLLGAKRATLADKKLKKAA